MGTRAPIPRVWRRLQSGLVEHLVIHRSRGLLRLPGSRKGKMRAENELRLLAEQGVEACTAGDRERAAALVAELIARLDLEDAAAQAVCGLYEDALAELRAGRFDGARALFQALRTV